MMIVVSNPECVQRMRAEHASNTEIVERALCRRLGIRPRRYRKKAAGRPKATGLLHGIPVKITDRRIVEYLTMNKAIYGVSYRFSVENAMLKGGKNEA